MTTRRDFLLVSTSSAALFSMAPMVPNFLLSTSAAAAAQASKGDNVLVVVQLSGGNDGLNTVVPYGDDIYHRNRFTTRITREAALKLDDYVGLHPSMTGLHELYDEQQLAIVQGVGYPNPDRSHFSSMDIWHAARRDVESMRRLTGWLGRYLDRRAAGGEGKADTASPALHLGAERQPLAVVAENVRVPSVSSIDGFKLNTGSDAAFASAIESAVAARRADAQGNNLIQFLQSSAVTAIASSKQMQDAIQRYKTDVTYPGTSLGKKLQTTAQLIDAGFSTRIYYLELGGFDTHSNQAPTHAAQLREFSDAVAAFMKDIKAHGHGERVLLLSFSEFGRRLKENASRGTDHGAGAPLFLAGAKVKPGLIGAHPSLTDLDSGDVKHHTDFRQVYATILDQWLKTDSKAVLGGAFKPVAALQV